MGKKTLYVLSFGLKPSHLTWEAAEGARACEKIYSHCVDGRAARHFPGFARKIKLIAGHDFTGMKAAILAAFGRHDTLGLLTYGNPCFIHPPTVDLIAAARSAGIEVRVLDAVSSFDSMVNLFSFAGPLHEVRLVSAYALPKKKSITFTPGLNTMFFAIDQLAGEAGAGSRERFARAAAGAYPAGAAVFLANCESISGGQDLVKGTIKGLRELLEKAGLRHTLFIPAAGAARRKYGKY
ncbi:MAG: hypothetical protein A2089_07995 [Elusimicrobia bacterium GWD2_63_28]|nr:MAG: hypothetical protein A2089_07995 [Elusimicrobia bacterium GWD2_63_28]